MGPVVHSLRQRRTPGMAGRCGLALVVAALVAAFVLTGVASAHGGEFTIGVSCMALDAARPLRRTCTAVVTFVDGDPVNDARLTLSGLREDGERRTLGPVPFQPTIEPGVYTVAFDYPAYGRWRTTVAATEPGEGEANLVEEVLPPVPGAVGPASGTARVRIVLDFDGRQLANIVMRVVHLGAAGAWFVASALVLVVSIRLRGPQDAALLRSLGNAFPRVAGVSFLVLALSGWYNALYNVPAASPGLFDPTLIGRLPFGHAYLLAFLSKMVLAVAIVLSSGALTLALRRARRLPRPIAGGAVADVLPAALPLNLAQRRVVLLGAVNVALGVLLFINVVVQAYLHILTHIAGLTAR